MSEDDIKRIDKEIEEIVKSAGDGMTSWEDVTEDEEYKTKK